MRAVVYTRTNTGLPKAATEGETDWLWSLCLLHANSLYVTWV